jgi:UDP-N-acetylmuramoylalanine--D-glutamate ligase
MDSFFFLRKKFPGKVLALADRKKFSELPAKIQKKIKDDKKTKLHFGINHLKFLKNYDVIIKAPGIPPKILTPFLSPKTKIISATEIFFDNCTASLIYEILKTSVKKVHLVGNIGKPVLRFLGKSTEKDIFIYELSCHQLFKLKKSPHIAVFLNIFPEHLDYYKNFQEYARAKENIAKYQTRQDYLIYNSQDKIVSKIAKKSKAKENIICIT